MDNKYNSFTTKPWRLLSFYVNCSQVSDSGSSSLSLIFLNFVLQLKPPFYSNMNFQWTSASICLEYSGFCSFSLHRTSLFLCSCPSPLSGCRDALRLIHRLLYLLFVAALCQGGSKWKVLCLHSHFVFKHLGLSDRNALLSHYVCLRYIFLAHQISISACFTCAYKSYLTHVISPRTG